MLDACLLGTGGMMPLPKRWLTSLMLRSGGSNILIDCGEGTQIALKEKGWTPKPIDLILFTHFHADHIAGLPGMLLSMANAGRTEETVLLGPKGLRKITEGLLMIVPELTFPLSYIEIDEDEGNIDFKNFHIEYFRVRHSTVCYGYKISIERIGKFNVEKARELNIPVSCWNTLQHGGTVEINGEKYFPEMVLGEKRKGLSVTYTTDTRPVDVIVKMARETDLFICEGMYGDKDKADNAKKYRHMTMYEAANLGKESMPKEMWFTHYSPSEMKPEIYKDEVWKIFPAKFAKPGWTKELKFED